jgi:hypothetical protein
VRERLGLVGVGAVGIPGLGLCRRHVEQAARPGDVVGAGATGEQAIVADAVEAVRQDVDQESADELGGCGYRRLSARPRHHAQAEGAIKN